MSFLPSPSASLRAIHATFQHYEQSTPLKSQLLDVYLAFLVLTGAVQFLYAIIVGTFPYNAFLAGFGSCVGAFCLAVNLRIQSQPKNAQVTTVTPERAFIDYLLCLLILFLTVINFIG